MPSQTTAAPDGSFASPVVVVGAGIVGVASALHLCRLGYPVVLVDREGPAAGASYGNGGILARCSILPVATPGLWRDAPRMLLSRDGPLFLRWAALPRLLPWLIRFMATATPARLDAAVRALAPLLLDSLDQHQALAEGTDAAPFIRPTDYVFLYRDRAAYERDCLTWTHRHAAGLTWRELEGEALRALEPDLSPMARRFGVAMPDHAVITDPGAYVEALAEAVVAAGGRFERAMVRALEPDETGVTVRTEGADLRASHVVLATGAWSDRLARPLGATVRLAAERGYHLELAAAEGGPRHPLMDAARKMVLVPMEGRLRAAGLVEFADLEAPAASGPTTVLNRGVAELFPGLRHQGTSTWMGPRPPPTDSVPVIGALPGARRVIAAYGHQHIGLTAGAATGRLVADLVAGRHPNIDLSAYRPDR
ncbi:FAD-binding oxidoreductase [Roseospira marina]|uniref:FAD-binding oxidoreductase n=1 Tax=Roseospira marina TaxID=140057 RepID=A0A5M6IGV3_9PROT|nr:FAD-binding oxidoreductase [Roseospira marina]KAA5606905.1 FAD-binding oxidoreductase [Roseospira marina]MBB4312924.1 D-amino-acid dehydrogenase [Roseospira marina]MBB5086303.1 D-amino-acid dehydrogenase [Roseospira marina]